MNWKSSIVCVLFLSASHLLTAQTALPPQSDPKLYTIANAASPQRLEADIRKLVNFGTRNTFSDTVSTTRGIGAARRWIKSEFEKISSACNS